MLELRPNCELCDKDLSVDSVEACICSYECTFCFECIEEVLQNVCSNCGGGFFSRPVRPAQEHRPGVALSNNPASTKRVNTNYTIEEIKTFANGVKDIPPAKR